MKFDEVYVVDADQSETMFLRRVYINLARNSYDTRILRGSFGKVETGVMQVAGCEAHVDTTYTYDRITYVTGTVMTKEQQRYGRSWREVEVPRPAQIPKNIPESGSTSGEAEGYVINLKYFTQIDNPDTVLYYMNYHIPEIGKLSKHLPDREYPRLELTDEAYIRSKQAACDIVNSRATLPDEYENLTFNPTCYVKRMTCYMVPYYTVSYTLGTESYVAKGFACSEPNVWDQCPDGINNSSMDEYAEKKTGIKVIKYLFPVLTWVTFAVAVIISCVLGLDAYVSFFVPFGIYLIHVIAYHAACSRFNNYASKMQPKWTNRMTKALNALFSGLGMAPLTPEEVQEFSSIDFASMKEGKVHSYSDISKYSLFTLVVLCVTLVVAFFITVALLT